jgi:hypothetical protein
MLNKWKPNKYVRHDEIRNEGNILHFLMKVLLLLSCVYYMTPSYGDTGQHRLEVKQRRGNMFVKLHDYNAADTVPLVCVIQGSGNNLEAEFNPRKVLKVNGSLLMRGKVIISIRKDSSDEVIARCDTVISLSNATLLLPDVTVQGVKRPIKSRVSHSMGMPSFMITENDQKLKLFTDLDLLLRNAGVKSRSDEYGIRHLLAHVVVVDADGEIEEVPPVSISPSDVKQIDIYRGFKNYPDVVVIQLKREAAY